MNISKELAHDQIKVIKELSNTKKIYLHVLDVITQKEVKVIIYLEAGAVGIAPITEGPNLDITWHFLKDGHCIPIESYVMGELAYDIIEFIYDYYYSIPQTIFE